MSDRYGSGLQQSYELSHSVALARARLAAVEREGARQADQAGVRAFVAAGVEHRADPRSEPSWRRPTAAEEREDMIAAGLGDPGPGFERMSQRNRDVVWRAKLGRPVAFR